MSEWQEQLLIFKNLNIHKIHVKKSDKNTHFYPSLSFKVKDSELFDYYFNLLSKKKEKADPISAWNSIPFGFKRKENQESIQKHREEELNQKIQFNHLLREFRAHKKQSRIERNQRKVMSEISNTSENSKLWIQYIKSFEI